MINEAVVKTPPEAATQENRLMSIPAKIFWIYLVRVGKYPPRYWDFAGHIEKS